MFAKFVTININMEATKNWKQATYRAVQYRLLHCKTRRQSSSTVSSSIFHEACDSEQLSSGALRVRGGEAVFRVTFRSEMVLGPIE
jgi:hypothetical protein